MSQIKLFVKNVFEFNQRDFWILIVLNILTGLVLRFFKVDEFVQAGALLGLLVKSISFYRSTSVMPSISSDFDRFSWKYLQGLPLNKKELILAVVVSNLIAVAPLITWIVSFAPQIGNFLLFEGEEVLFNTKMKLLLISVPVLLVISFYSLQNIIKLPRNQYSKIHSRIAFYQAVKRISVGLFLFIYGLFVLGALNEFTGQAFSKFLGSLFKFSLETLASWWIIPISILFVLLAYFRTLKVLQDESIGYIKQTWSTKRDVSIIVVCAVLNIGLFHNLDFGIPAEYQGTKLTKVVFRKNYKEISMALKKGANINKATRYGFTPIMVAAREGDYEMFKFLLQKGAELKGNIQLKRKNVLNGANIFSLAVKGGESRIIKELLNKGFDVNHVTSEYGSSPLHIASNSCNSKVVDLLIENKAYLNSVDKYNETALHKASHRGCFAAVVSLIEAGINPMVKSKQGKLAKDYANKYPKDLDYYLEKRSREPAGK